MNYYLVKKSKYFYDNSGCAELGSIKIEISTDSSLDDLDESETYDKDYYLLEPGHDEDFYDCTSTEVTFKKISEEEAEKYKTIIKDYETLLNLI